jgi:ribonuclease P protein component
VPRFKHTAVSRNLVKRRLRELARIHLVPTGISVDVVLRIRPEAYDASFDRLATEIRSTIGQLRSWFESHDALLLPSGETPSNR